MGESLLSILKAFWLLVTSYISPLEACEFNDFWPEEVVDQLPTENSLFMDGIWKKLGALWHEVIKLILLLMEEILHHLGCIKPYKQWYILPIHWCRISAINSIIVHIDWYFLNFVHEQLWMIQFHHKMFGVVSHSRTSNPCLYPSTSGPWRKSSNKMKHEWDHQVTLNESRPSAIVTKQDVTTIDLQVVHSRWIWLPTKCRSSCGWPLTLLDVQPGDSAIGIRRHCKG